MRQLEDILQRLETAQVRQPRRWENKRATRSFTQYGNREEDEDWSTKEDSNSNSQKKKRNILNLNSCITSIHHPKAPIDTFSRYTLKSTTSWPHQPLKPLHAKAFRAWGRKRTTWGLDPPGHRQLNYLNLTSTP